MKKKWRIIFLELTLRAIRKVHYEFGVWTLGQEDLTLEHFKNLNQGQGINFAPEETVRDSILQEIIYTGLWKEHKINNDPTSYWIDREVKVTLNKKKAIKLDVDEKLFRKDDYENPDKFESDEKYFKIDLVFKRIQDVNQDGVPTYPALIEAKRFNLVDVDPRNSTFEIKEPQLTAIDKDISKLKLLKDYFNEEQIKIRNESFKKFFSHILLWGISQESFDIKTEVLDKLTKKDLLLVDDCVIKYLPIEWEYTDKLKIKQLLWVTLIEVE